MSPHHVPSPLAGEAGRRPDEGARHLPDAQPSPARVPPAGPERPLPASGEVTTSCLRTTSLLPSREKLAEGRMRGPATCPRRSTLTRSSPARGTRATSPGLGRGDNIMSPHHVPSPLAGEGGRRPDEGARHLPDARPSPARVPPAGPERPLPASGEVTTSCLRTTSLLPSREKLAEGRMRGPATCPRRSTLTRSSPARGTRATSPGLGRGDNIMSPHHVPSPLAGEGGRRPDEGARHLPDARPSPARVPPAGPERPLPASGEVTTSCLRSAGQSQEVDRPRRRSLQRQIGQNLAQDRREFKPMSGQSGGEPERTMLRMSIDQKVLI